MKLTTDIIALLNLGLYGPFLKKMGWDGISSIPHETVIPL
jgi:hypothetical protein